ncbi:solute carrier family 25 member 45 [Gambusia affinis]|uniref:solute carrier family 25 member 45 n=1 Tax=Gambusia affinis TaxID=33528 RepID=UPI001CDCFC8A|nr:solute carrier family 25 member 45 [Gambusia affinis]XP_043972963.1 solute carrier family 25 member 45 [Gambusia affinis]XP_043972972.1 solute carrier family 25 member 45 [Gambusia affinis]XP_043972978.1 solute carrier family 25 member 45 [Gambusia affinis]XP_043972986.1 solute carrier family 25 member 45 [Gambusia affinis]XP_043972994.1 solute carrier family 25 member 45 [Gambusia affinis]XP_043973002.1 solute carrier family 25 member 45 [Gambusia affinis]XP_043973008.1 solute carrier fa
MPFLEFVAGSISGAVGIAVGHPLDTVKVRLQAKSVYKGIFDCVTKTYLNEGFHGFFKGMSFPVLTTGLANSIVFGSYSNALDYLSQSDRCPTSHCRQVSSLQVFTAGCFSGIVQVLVCAPVDLVKVRLQGQTTAERYRGPIHCVAVILQQEGVRGLYRGAAALALRDVPCYGLYFLPYELTRKALTETGEEPGTFAILMAGGVAGVVTWACATPMDVVKARLQMSGAGGQQYSGVLHCIRVSLKEEGVRVFFKGLLLNSVRAFPVNAVTFLTYESLLKSFCPSGK